MAPSWSVMRGTGRQARVAVGVVVFAVLQVAMTSSRVDARGAYPDDVYFMSFRSHYDGDYRDSLRGFTASGRSGVRSTLGRWIDSICYYTMIGECHYQMGKYDAALAQYEAALELFLNHRDWMMRIEFPPAIGPSTSRIRETIAWGTSSRPSTLGHFPETMKSFQGRMDNELAYQYGGVVSAPRFHPVHVDEIVRCTALALRRRMELLGPACPHDPLSTRLMDALAQRPGPVNHWSRAWVNVQLGLAYASAGRVDQAVSELQSSILVAGEYDHPLTATAQLELGKLMLQQDQLDVASALFLDATLSAAEFEQADLMEEAFRYGFVTHLATNAQDLYAPLAAATVWAGHKRFQQLYASLLILAAENHAALRQTAPASRALEQARRAIGRQDMMGGLVGLRYQYQLAHVNYQGGHVEAGNAALTSALHMQRQGSSRWLFQIGKADQLYRSGTITPRTAEELYAEVLREPTARDWAFDPMETLSLVTTPQLATLESWFQVALQRKSVQAAIEIADQIRRQRFYASLPLGGRLLALRWILEAQEAALTKTARLQRQELRNKYPHYLELSQQAEEVRQALAALPLDAGDSETIQRQGQLLERLEGISVEQERLLREIAVRREPSEFVFPPRRSTAEIQKALADGELALVYFVADRAIHAFMVSKDNYATWLVSSPTKLKRQLGTVLRTMGNLDHNKEVSVETLKDTRWTASSRLLLDQLIDTKQHGFWNRFHTLVVVPDDLLWHVPFEALQIPNGDETQSLGVNVQIRYLPMASMIVPDQRGRRPLTRNAVVVGRLFPSEESNATRAAFVELQAALPNLAALHYPPVGPTGIYRSVWDRLIVLHQTEDSGRGPFDFSPAQMDEGKPGSALSRWMELPWGGPDQVILPAHSTAAAQSLKRTDEGDMFLTICGLMASGTRTILISRWRTGGKTSVDLVREFLSGLSDHSPLGAWHRSVSVVRAAEIDGDQEPRVAPLPHGEPMTAEHPFFWSGYMLIDSTGRMGGEG